MDIRKKNRELIPLSIINYGHLNFNVNNELT